MTDATPASQPPGSRPSANPLQPVLFEVKRTIVGQDVLLERMAIAMLCGGHQVGGELDALELPADRRCQ